MLREWPRGVPNVCARDRIEGAVIGITGSVGKTSVKDLLAAICGGAGVTTASARSLNNEMGVPLTLINAAPGTERTIVEMGARGAGHIAYLCGIARPTIGVVTTVAEAHTEMFGSIDGVAAAKSELIAALPASGAAILNAEVPLVAAMASVATGDVVTFGNGGDVAATAVRLDADLHAHFTLSSPWGSAEISLGVRGEHNVANALAAAAAALVSGVSMDHVVAGLAAAELSPSRMDLSRLASGGIVLNDAYNANPASMLAGLRALAALDVGRRVAVLGLMAELGDDAATRHREMAEVASGLGIEVVAVGTDLYGIVPLTDADEVLARIAPPVDGEAVLLKGSRIAGLDRVAQAWLPAGRPPQ